MKQSVTQEELIKCIGHESYLKFAKDVYNLIVESDSYKSNDEAIFYIGALPLNDEVWFEFEATLKKVSEGNDFGFTKMIITDDLDVILDRINDCKKVLKGKFINKNK